MLTGRYEEMVIAFLEPLLSVLFIVKGQPMLIQYLNILIKLVCKHVKRIASQNNLNNIMKIEF